MESVSMIEAWDFEFSRTLIYNLAGSRQRREFVIWCLEFGI